VAREGIFRGVRIINDISAGRDPEMLELQRLFSGHPLYFLMMHCQGNPKTMQVAPHYPDGVVTEVHRYLEGRVNAFIGAGWKREQLWVDPGIGFGKTPEHCLLLLKHLKDFSTLGGRVAIGTSRKSFIARAIHEPNLSFDLREPGTIASNLWAFTQGARVFRVHDVASFKRAWRLWERIEDARQS
jgi:dihydropteroate synthase